MEDVVNREERESHLSSHGQEESFLVNEDRIVNAKEEFNDTEKENRDNFKQPSNSPLPDKPPELPQSPRELDNSKFLPKNGLTNSSQLDHPSNDKGGSRPGLHPEDRLFQLSQQWLNTLDPLRLKLNPEPHKIEGVLGVKLISTQPFIKVTDPPPGYGRPVPFHIFQRKPFTTTPLQAWRGYHGNVYFDPVHISTSSLQKPNFEVRLPPIHHRSEQFQKAIAKSRWDPEHVIEYRQRCEDSREQVLFTANAKLPRRQNPRSDVQLDPALLLENSMESRLLRMTLHTGTLHVVNPTSPNSPTRSPSRSPRGRLHKGFVLRGNKSASSQVNNLVTPGSPIKFRPPQTSNSP